MGPISPMVSHSADQTKKIAAELAATLTGGEVILLFGELGAGKTVFVQGLAEALGVQGPVRSPTFAIMNVYKFGAHRAQEAHGEHTAQDIKKIIHLDFYRTASSHGLGLEEYLGQPDTLVVIEWPPEDLDLCGARAIKVSLKMFGETDRDIHIA